MWPFTSSKKQRDPLQQFQADLQNPSGFLPPTGMQGPTAPQRTDLGNETVVTRKKRLPPSLPPRKGAVALMRKASNVFFGHGSIPPPPPPGRKKKNNNIPQMRKASIPLPPPPRFFKKASMALPPPPRFKKRNNNVEYDGSDEPMTEGGGMLTKIKSSFTMMARGSVPLPPPPRRRYNGGGNKVKNEIEPPARTDDGGPSAPPRNFPPPKSLMMNHDIVVPPPPPRNKAKKKQRNNQAGPPPMLKKSSIQNGLKRFASQARFLAAKGTVYGFGDQYKPPPPPPPKKKGKGGKQTVVTRTNIDYGNTNKVVAGKVKNYGKNTLKKNGGTLKSNADPSASNVESFLPKQRKKFDTTGRADGRDWVRVTKGWARSSMVAGVKQSRTKYGTAPLPKNKPWDMKKVNTVDNGVIRRKQGKKYGTAGKGGTLGRNKVTVPMPDPNFAPYGSRLTDDRSSHPRSREMPLSYRSDPNPGLRKLESRFNFWHKREGTLPRKR